MKRLIVLAAIAMAPILAYCQQPSNCEVLVRMWARNMAYTSACNDQTGLEQELARDQQGCRSIGKKKAEQLIADELQSARESNLENHAAYCRDTKALFQSVKDSLTGN